MGQVAAVLLAALVSLGSARLASADSEPTAPARAAVERALAEVLAVLRDEGLSAEARRAAVREIAYRQFDFDTLSRLVVGSPWKTFTALQKTEFEREFQRYLAGQYGDRIDRYDDQEIEITGARPEARGDVTVKTLIRGSGMESVALDFRMRRRDAQWLAIDAVIEGVSLVANYRDQFRSVISREGVEGLLSRLREKNAADSG